MRCRCLLLGLIALSVPLLASLASAESLTFRTLQQVSAVPLARQDMHRIRGKATPALMQFLQQATQTQLGGGVTLWTLCPDGCLISATWYTGSSNGTATISK